MTDWREPHRLSCLLAKRLLLLRRRPLLAATVWMGLPAVSFARRAVLCDDALETLWLLSRQVMHFSDVIDNVEETWLRRGARRWRWWIVALAVLLGSGAVWPAIVRREAVLLIPQSPLVVDSHDELEISARIRAVLIVAVEVPAPAEQSCQRNLS